MPRTNPRTLVNLVIVALAVVGVIAILGWLVSAVVWLIRLAVLVLVAAVAVALVKLAVRSGRDRR